MLIHYVYYAIGFNTSLFCIKSFLYGHIELALQAYIGVRTGIWPDLKYKTSSSARYNKEWLYIGKNIICILESRKDANEHEDILLKLLAENNTFKLLANKQCAGIPGYGGHSEATKQKIALGNKNKEISQQQRLAISETLKHKYADGTLFAYAHKYTMAERESISKALKEYHANNEISLETKAKISSAVKLAHAEGRMPSPTNWPEESLASMKAKISKLHKDGKYEYKPKSKDTKLKIRDSKRTAKMFQYPIVLLKDGETIELLSADAFYAFCENNMYSASNLRRLINGKAKSCYGYILNPLAMNLETTS